VFVQAAPGDYAPNSFDAKHPTMGVRNMFPVERTFSEWSQSEYATTGVYAPQFAGTKPDGIVSTCQDCHMHDVDARGCSEAGSPRRLDLPQHDMMGGNYFMADVLPALHPGEVDVTALQDAKQRAIGMLQKAATMAVTPENFGVSVRITNETGHKLPSGYPEGRRIWLNVVARDLNGVAVYESGAYDPSTGALGHDPQLKIYELHAGLSPALAGALGMPAGPSFHFVLSDTIFMDNRIPPRGFANAAFAAVQSPPVDYSYADGQYWDDTPYILPREAKTVTVTLYYQSTSKEYVEFLRDENVTNAAGQVMYDAWVAAGKAAPVVMQQTTVPVDVTVDVAQDDGPEILADAVERSTPNPFKAATRIAYAVARTAPVRISIYDVRGRQIRVLVDEVRGPGRHSIEWNGRTASGSQAPAGVYLVDGQVGDRSFTQRIVRLR
jgi:hypothetical protein